MSHSALRRGLCLALICLLSLPVLPAGARSRVADVDTHCPLFGHAFTAQALVGKDDFAAFDSDLCKRPRGTSLYILSVWTCPYCFFSAYQADYVHDLDPSYRDMELRHYRLEKPPTEVQQWEIFIGLKYHNAETFYRRAGKDAWFLADLMLRGTYACRVTKVRETPELARLRERWISEAWHLETRYSAEEVNLALAGRLQQEIEAKKIAADQMPAVRYLLADALRQAGAHGEAAGIFEDLLKTSSLTGLLRQGARNQILLCRKEQEFQDRALGYLQQAEKEGIVPEENRALAVYLQAELSRRLGKVDQARSLYRRAREIPAEQEWLGALIEKQEGRLGVPDSPRKSPPKGR